MKIGDKMEKCYFLKIPQWPDFENLGGHSHHQDVPKELALVHFFSLESPSHPMCTLYIRKYDLTLISTGVCGGADRGTVQLSEGGEIY